MSISAFETRKLLGVVQEFIEPFTPFQSMFFSRQEVVQSEYVDLDKDNVGLKIATHVERDATERPIEKQSFAVHTFRIPYMKPIATIEPRELTQRMPGETIYGDSSMASRGQALVVRTMKDLDARIQRRIEVMSAQLADTGSVSVVDSNGHAVRTISFPRNSDHNQTLTGNDLWTATHADADPIEDMEAMQDLIIKNSGFSPDFIWMASDVWKALRGNTKFTSAVGNYSQYDMLQLSSKAQEKGMRFVGFSPIGLPMYVISAVYGATKLVPNGRFGMGCTNASHRTLYGPIHDFNDAGEVIAAAAARFPTSWVTKNPAILNVQLHSAPLPFTENFDSFCVWTVI